MNAKSSNDSDLIITHTKKWLSTVIIAHNFCPFAKKEVDKNSVHFEVISSKKIENQLQALIFACKQLDGDNSVETSLLIYPSGLSNFDNYLDFLDIATALLDKQGYEGTYQLASFHPNYQFDDTEADDASNYTNRSPYPMLHLLREATLEKVLSKYPNPEEIPERNIKHTQKLGTKTMQALLSACYEP